MKEKISDTNPEIEKILAKALFESLKVNNVKSWNIAKRCEIVFSLIKSINIHIFLIKRVTKKSNCHFDRREKSYVLKRFLGRRLPRNDTFFTFWSTHPFKK